MLFFTESGEGLPVLLLHAGVADGRMWAPQIRAFSDSFRVISCDLPGFGRSSLPDGPFAYHEDVATLLDALHIQSTWLVGASFGARVAVDVCLTYPARVRGLILVAPLVSGYKPGEQIKAFGEEEDALLDAGDLDAATELNLRMWVDGPYRQADQVDAGLRASIAQMQRRAFEIPVPANTRIRPLEPPAAARLGEIQVPVLIVAGELDVPEVVAFSEQLADSITGSRRVVVSGVAHMITMEVPQQFNELALEFIANAEANAPHSPA